MNLGIVVHNYHRREGTGAYVVRLLPYLAAAHEVTLYAARVREPVPEDVTVVRVPAVMTRAATAVMSFPAAFRTVRRSHDLLHAQGWVTGTADVVTAHIAMAAWREASRRAGLAPALGERLIGPFIERRERALYGTGARHVIVPSRKVAAELGEYYGRSGSVTVVPHGFPPVQPNPDRHTARRHLALPTDQLVALYVGDIRKGLDVALRAVAQRPEFHLAVVSRSRPGDCLARAQALGLGRRFHWVGAMSDLAETYAAADVLLHPTIYDSFGLVIAEAMAHGVPPVTTRQAGIAELITHREHGWLVDGELVAGVAAALAEAGADATLRTRVGDAARSLAAGRQWDAVARDTLAVYDRVLAAQ